MTDKNVKWCWQELLCSWLVKAHLQMSAPHNLQQCFIYFFQSDFFFFQSKVVIIIIIIYPLTARVAGAPQMIPQSVSSIFLCSLMPSGTWRTPGLSIPWCCLPTSSSVCLVFLPLSLCLQDGFGQIWWTGDMSIRCLYDENYKTRVQDTKCQRLEEA